MSGALAGRGAVVTGGGRGIGAAVARALADAGASVVVAARTTSEIERVAASLRERGGQAWAVVCDVADEAAVATLGTAARGLMPAVDVLVNNAGVSGSSPLKRMTLADWQHHLAVNATGTFLCTREFLPAMVERGFGRVINVASMVGLAGGRYVAHYAASKHAVIGFTRSVALELDGTGVTINALCPPYVDTPMTDQTLANVRARTGLDADRALAAVLDSAGQERLMPPEEVAAAVLALCAESAISTNGAAIRLPDASLGAGGSRAVGTR